MPCYSPISGWRSKHVNPETGKRSIVFNPKEGFADMAVDLPCGQCIGCRLEKSRQWAMRCVHEAQLHEDNSFITLTYNDEHLPEDASLDVRHFQNFMKRFRKSIAPKKVRFFHCGEYGDHNGTYKHERSYGISDLGRPHYHAIIFGHDFSGKELIKEQDGIRLYHSQELAELWPYGFNTVGAVTFESAAYVARYVVKKKYGEEKEDHYTRINTETGELYQVKPEYVTMSRRPGIGAKWFEEFSGDVYPKDYTHIRGKKIKPPRYYDKLLEELDDELHQRIKNARRDSANNRADDNTRDRLFTKEKVKKVQAGMLYRSLDAEEQTDYHRARIKFNREERENSQKEA